MSEMRGASLTVPEAAFVADLKVRTVNHEIDERIIRLGRTKGVRTVRGTDLLYLGAIRTVRIGMAPRMRRRVHDAIVEASLARRDEAKIGPFTLALHAIEQDLLGAFTKLERVKRDHVESLPGVLAGEPVLKGTRIAARHVADLVKRGANPAEIGEDLELTHEQIEAAVIFDRVNPKIGRPIVHKTRAALVSAAR